MKRKTINERIWDRLEAKVKFRLELTSTRSKFGIPTADGFKNEASCERWEKRLGPRKERELIKKSGELVSLAINLLKTELPFIEDEEKRYSVEIPMYLYVIKGRGGIAEYLRRNTFGCSFMFVDQLDKKEITYLKRIHPKGMLIVFDPDVTQKDLVEFVTIKHKWNAMRARSWGNHSPRIRSYGSKKDDQLLRYLWKNYSPKSIRQLREISGKMSYDRYEAIATIAEKELGRRITSGALRKRVERWKKRGIL